MKTYIAPVSVFPNIATQISVVGASIKKFGNEGRALVHWQLLDVNDRPLTSGSVEVDGVDYAGWNEDSPYLLDVVVSKLKLTKVSPPPAPAAADPADKNKNDI